MTFDARAEAHALADQVVAWRRHLHAHPELSNRETATAAWLQERLTELEVDELRTGLGGHGVVAVLRGRADGADQRTMLLRADMDALPVPDECGDGCASTVVDEDYPGGPFPVSHACGHDAHTAMLLGAGTVLARHRDDLAGTVVLLFQGAEEGAPVGEHGGARAMLDDGALDGLAPTMAFGMHVGPAPTGTILLHAGSQYAASCLVEVTLEGRQVHASMPWEGADPFPAMADVITGSAQLYRRVPASTPVTVSFGHVEDHGRFNVIGGSLRMTGTIRAGSTETLHQLQEMLDAMVRAVASAHGVQGSVRYLQEVPALEHTPEWLAAVRPSLAAVVGEEHLVAAPAGMGYDDMSELVREYGGVYPMLGAQDLSADGRGMVPNHHPAFYVDEAALPLGVALHLQVTLDHFTGRLDPPRTSRAATSAE